jgi:hypothetical protein
MRKRFTLVLLLTFGLIISFSVPNHSMSLLQAITPEARGMHGMAYDPYNDVVVVFGGTTLEGGIHSLGDTWTYSYSANTWTELVLTPSPPPRSNLAMVYCNATEEIILFSGQGIADTWSFDVRTQTWSEVITSVNPGIHHSHGMAYDPQENAVILFGGFGEDGMTRDDTWKFECVAREWTQLFPETSPLARYGHVMAYDESINRIVLSCGNTASQGHQDDTWTYNTATNTWTEITALGTPGALKWPSMTYDSANERCILFGGQVGDIAVDDTKIYDAHSTVWSSPAPPESPSARICTGLAFDSDNNVTILFGGWLVEGGQLGDTWTYTYDTNTWLNMEDVTTTTTSTSTTTSTTTTSSTTTTTTAPPNYLPLVITGAIGIVGLAVVIVLVVLRKQG